MASATRTEVMNASKENILAVLKDYESYSEFMDGVSSVKVLQIQVRGFYSQYILF